MIYLILFIVSSAFASPVREMNLKPNDVGTIHTSFGYSTVIQFSEKPLNVVLGDQNAFRIEFIKDSITIKPTGSGLKTNLFIFTENDRFNLAVESGARASTDYVVRVHRIFSDPEKTSQLNGYRTVGNVRIHLFRVTYRDGNSFFDFAIENLGHKNIILEPELFRVTKNNHNRPLISLYLEKDIIRKSEIIKGSFKIPKTESSSSLSVWVGFKDQAPKNFSFGNGTHVSNERL